MVNHPSKCEDNKFEGIELTEWIVVDGYCATRLYKGTILHEEYTGNRAAFIEKSFRVRTDFYDVTKPWMDDSKKWHSLGRGSGGHDPEENGYYGFDQESRDECDEELRRLGYIFN